MGDTKATRVVTGEVVLPNAELPAKAARLVVRVEDVSRADAPSEVIGQARLSDVSLTPGATLPFSVEIPASQIDDRRMYSVSAHVDVSGSGEVEVGDLITMQSYPVLARNDGDQVKLNVKPVK